MVKQEILALQNHCGWWLQPWNSNILGISELKWVGIGKFNIYYCGQESLRRNSVALIVNKRAQNAVLGCNLENDRKICVHLQEKLFNITIIQVYSPTTDVKSWIHLLLGRPTTPSRTNTKKKKKSPFHHRGLECKSWKSREIWNNRQVWPWNAKWSRAKTNRVWSREYIGHSKHPFPTI